MAEEVKLIGMWACPFHRRVEMALKLKGIQYEYIEEDLSNKSPLLLHYNPFHKKLPVLVHNGKPIAESLVILEYIDETWRNNPIMPPESYNTAMARFWAKFVDEKLLPTASKSAMSEGEEKEKLIIEFGQHLKILEDELKKGQKIFFGGESIGYLDLVAFSILYPMALKVPRNLMLREVIITQEEFPALCQWLEKMGEIDTVKESLPHEDKYLAFVKARIQAKKALRTQ